MVNYYLIITFIIAAIAILYFWYMARNGKYIPDNEIIYLDTSDNHLLSDWYNRFIKSSIYFDINSSEIGARILKRLYDLDIDPHFIVIGNNLISKYYDITQKTLPIYNMEYIPGSDIIFDIRSCLGFNYELAIIHNSRIKDILQQTYDDIDLNDTVAVMDNKLDIIAKDYIEQILDYRWNKIRELNDNNVLNNSGTFLYLHDCNIPNIESANTRFGYRINLLCTDREFETLIKRWNSNLLTKIL